MRERDVGRRDRLAGGGGRRRVNGTFRLRRRPAGREARAEVVGGAVGRGGVLRQQRGARWNGAGLTVKDDTVDHGQAPAAAQHEQDEDERLETDRPRAGHAGI